MKLKIKPIDKNNWKRVTKKKTAFTQIEEREGVAFLLKIQELVEPLVKPCFGRDVILADVGYYWLQIAFKDENFWLTVMYNEKGEFVQYYFDVTRKNVIDGVNSYFEDLFIDVIVHGKNEVQILDADELKLALGENLISCEEFEFANSVAQQIIQNILNNREKYDRLCEKYFEILRKKIIGD